MLAAAQAVQGHVTCTGSTGCTLQHVLLFQVLDLSQTPDLEGPQYTVLRVTKDYEIRRYEPFVVAEAPMGPGSSEGLAWIGACCPAHTVCSLFCHCGLVVDDGWVARHPPAVLDMKRSSADGSRRTSSRRCFQCGLGCDGM